MIGNGRMHLRAVWLAMAVVVAAVGPAWGETANPCCYLHNVEITVSDAPDPVSVGSLLTYTVTVFNGIDEDLEWGPWWGPWPLIHLPSEVSFVSANVTQGTWSVSGNLVTWDFGIIHPGNTATATVVVLVNSGDRIICWADVSYEYESDPDWPRPMDFNANGIVARQTTTISSGPDLLSITKQDWPDPVIVGRPLQYRLSVVNRSASGATGVVVTDNLPATVSFVSAKTDRGSFSVAGRALTWNVGSLESTGEAVLEMAVTPAATGAITDTAQVTANEPDPNPVNNTAQAQTQVVTHDYPVMERIGDGIRGRLQAMRNVSVPADGRFVGFGVETTMPLVYTQRVYDRVTGVCMSADVNSYGEPAAYIEAYLAGQSWFPWPGFYAPTFSDDGRLVSYISPAYNLVPGDTNCSWDAFVRDLMTQQTERASISPEGWQMHFYMLDYPDWYRCNRPWFCLNTAYSFVSGDGARVLFGFPDFLISYWWGMIGDFVAQLQMHDRRSKLNSIVVRWEWWSHYGVSMSSDARLIAYHISDYRISDRDQIQLQNVPTGSSKPISISPDGELGNGDSRWPWISSDGRRVAYESTATNLCPADTNGTWEIYVYDIGAGRNTLASVSFLGGATDGPSFRPSISSDGRYVAFESDATNLAPGDLNGLSDIFVRDMQSGKTYLVSRSGALQANGPSIAAVISGDGRFVFFDSEATNLVSGDTNGTHDLYACDWQRQPPWVVVKIDCGGPAAGVWSKDVGFTGGRTLVTWSVVAGAGAVPQLVYQTCRAGKFDYSFRDIPNGTYKLQLHFAEPYYSTRGARVFDVYAENRRVITGLDVFTAAGGKLKALVREVQVTVSDGNGLQLSFRPVKLDAIVSGIEISRM